ncbi:MAG: hypothetical protein HYZ54_10810 [Ignavibacteriae bacterium]|nr:hypothetical protein [Ignavibacteriota bacterium]
MFKYSTLIASLAVVALGVNGCKDETSTPSTPTVELKNYSTTPALVKKMPGFESVEVFSLIGSDDKLTDSPTYTFGGSADGMGWLKNNDGGFTMLVNQEDNFSVSRITFDKTLKPIKGEYILNSDGGVWRLCSATMVTPEEHGFGPMFLTCGESGEESRTHAINPFDPSSNASMSRELPAFGRWSAENALPLPKTAYSGKTVIVITDDDSGVSGGQVALYVSNTVGDLSGGTLYMLRRKDQNQKETDMSVGTMYDVEFVKIDNQSTLTGKEINALVDVNKAIKFGRVEDIDYRKGSNGRDVYFTVTGQDYVSANADKSRTKYGRVYHLNLDATNPLAGKLEVIMDGDDRTGPAQKFQNPDNICVTSNYVYVQEDANGYKDETHDAYIYQYNLATKEVKVVFELDHHRDAADKDIYNCNATTGTPELSSKGSWEYGGMVDISDVIGIPNTFALAIQPHTWVGTKYKGVDKGTKRASEWQASQVIILKGLAR